MGLGDRPLMTATPVTAPVAVDGEPLPDEPTGFWRRHVFSTDHKVIGRQFLFLGLGFLAVGGIMAMLIRWQLARPGAPVPFVGKLFFGGAGGVISPPAYTALFTMHGTIMIFFAVTPILIGGFGNFLLPLLIGARDMAFPRLNMASFWTMAAATGVLCASFFVPLGPPQAGWTAYAPLSTALGTPGRRPDAVGDRDLPERRLVGDGRGQLHHDGAAAARPGHDLDAAAADGLGPVPDVDPERAVRAGAGARRWCCCCSTGCSARSSSRPAPRPASRAATRSCTSTCSGCSATPRSTS